MTPSPTASTVPATSRPGVRSRGRAKAEGEPGGERPAGHHVPGAPVDAGGADADEDLAGTGHRVGHLLEPEHVVVP